MNPLKRLAGQTVLYGLGSMLPRMLNFFLVSLHTVGMFTKEEYGAVTKLMAVVAFVNVIFMFGMETTFFRFSTKEGADRKRVFNLAQTGVLLISVPLTILFIVFASPIAIGFEVGQHPEFIIWLTAVMLIDAAVAIPFARMRLDNQPLRFATAKIVNVLVLIALNLYFLKIAYDPSVNIGYVFLANLIANAIFMPFVFKDLITWRPAIDRVVTPAMFRYAFPIMLTGLAFTFNEMFSRLTIDWWLPENFYSDLTTKEAGGVFGAYYKFAVFMGLGIQAFRYAAEPFFFSNAVEKNSPALFAKVNHYFIVTCCVVLLGISINLDLLQYLIGKNYWHEAGQAIVPVLLLANLMLGVYYNFSVWYKLTDKTHYGTIITVTGALITLGANYWLIPHFGFVGSSWATLACYGGMAILCYLIGQKFYPIPYSILKGIAYIIITLGIVLVVNRITIDNLWLATTFHAGIIVVYLIVVYLIERRNLRQLVV